MTEFSTSASAPSLTGVRVVEFASDPAGEFTGQMLSDLGAEVIKVEPENGSPTRSVGPFAAGRRDHNSSLTFWYYNTNKRSVVCDIGSEQGRADLERLLETADIFLSTLQPSELKALNLDFAELRARFPRLIILSVTPFGLSGPWADRLSSDLVALALGGPLNMCGYDDHTISPIRPGGNQAYHTAASYAQIGALLALLEREQSGRGQLVDVSMHEALAVTVELANPYWFYPRSNVYRQTCRHAQPTPTQPALFLCADGRYVYFALILSDQKPWKNLVQWMDSKGMAADLTDPAYSEFKYRQANFSHIQELVECFFLVNDADLVFHEGQGYGLPIGILNAPEDLKADEHLKVRDFFVPVQYEGVGEVSYPGPVLRYSAIPPVRRSRAPNLGEHTNSILNAISGTK